MSFAKVYSGLNNGINAQLIAVETDISGNRNGFVMVGLADKAVEESRERVSTALKNSGFLTPFELNQKTTISLIPSHIKKTGSFFDLAIALAFLKAKQVVDFNEKQFIFSGELSLSGKLLPVQGLLPVLLEAKKRGIKKAVVPTQNAREASLVEGVQIHLADSLKDVVNFLKNEKQLPKASQVTVKPNAQSRKTSVILDEIVGQEFAKRAIQIAASGGHNIAFYGLPGAGKTMLAQTLANLLPPLDKNQIIESTSIYSVAGLLNDEIVLYPPFRDPHHSSSFVSIVGGGADIKPGEISLAHNGVLFLDELPEFEARTVNALRQPMESGYVSISRAKHSVKYPARFLLVAAFNLCPCGFYGTDKCVCMPHQIQRYQNKISGPIIDRIDMWVEIEQTPTQKILDADTATSSTQHAKAQKLISNTRKAQQKEFGKLVSGLYSAELKQITLKDSQKQILQTASENLNLSTRALYKIIKVAKTISLMDNSTEIKDDHLLEAISYRKINFGSLA